MTKKPTDTASRNALPEGRRLRGIEQRKRPAADYKGGQSDSSRFRETREAMRAIQSAARVAPRSPDAEALVLFPGDVDRARRLYAAHKAMLHSLKEAAREFDLAPPEQRAVLGALLTALPDAVPAGLTLPSQAPELWTKRDLNLRENAPQFVRRVYAAWLGRGLARKDLAKLDDDLYKALAVWLSRHPDDEIGRMLPPQSEMIDGIIERLSAEFPVEVLRKLGYAIDSRLRRNPDSSK